MARDAQPAACSIQRATDVLGDRWTLLILRDALFGRTRYSQFQTNLGIASDILSAKLAKLVDEGLLRRQAYQRHGERERFEYRLTPAGRALHPLIAALGEWGEVMRPAGDSRAPRFAVADTGEPVRLAFVRESGDVVDPSDVELQPNPPRE
jgi:DNA-binding HxlR family transcriptional regulator